ncbi:uncharacterized protein [Primulina eburnea]|uniref:uncharacterized protein isoform X1 n=2 Tax=Primulina eburnea TaxID=1245227 RepID=UPI003C6CACBC
MLSFPSKLFASRLPMNCVPRPHPSPNLFTVTGDKTYWAFGDYLVKIISPVVVHRICSYMEPCYCKEMPKTKSIWPVDTPPVVKYDKGQVTNSHLQILGNVNSEDDNKVPRRSHANKGRVPWNKGRRHSEETRQKIRQRTKEALKDPKVRKKMSECPRSLSNQTKERIRTSQTKLWGKRLQWKRSGEKFLHSWAESIATAAKMGGSDQQELDWDSYDKITREMNTQQLRHAEEIAKAKEIARIQAERAAQVKAEKMAKIAERRRELEENASFKGESVKKRNKRSKEEKEKLAEFQEVKLRERLMKIHRKKSILNQAIEQRQRSWEKFDLEFIKGEKLPKEVTLADQIRFANDRRDNQQLLN